MSKSYTIREWFYPVCLFFFLITFFVLFLNSIGLTIFSFWQKALIFFLSANTRSVLGKFSFPVVYFLLSVLFLYIIKIELFPAFLENITLIKTDEGEVKISQKAIWEVVEKKLPEFPFVKKTKLYIRAKNNVFILYLHTELVGDNSDLRDIEKKAYDLATGLRDYIYKSTGIGIKKVVVYIEGLRYIFREEESGGGREEGSIDK